MAKSLTRLIAVAAVCLVPHVAQASSLSYQWSGILDHCFDPAIFCDWWGGALVGGQFTYDTSSGAYTGFTSSVLGSSFDWHSPELPDTNPSDIYANTYTADASGGTFRVVINVPDVESDIISLHFTVPITGQPTLGVSGSVERRFAGPHLLYTFEGSQANLVDTAPSPVPDPTTLLLVGSAIVLGARRLRRGRAESSGTLG